uniref:Doublecortin domain-containing protein n=1 Tax=Heterorhabditis bacteriophora TaxID=37862 RepID=A0A1I7X1W1_HETBA
MAGFNFLNEDSSLLPLTYRFQSSMTSFMLPNIPVQPRNGMIRTYENDTRTFTRPYSAKTVFFYKEGDEYFTGIRVPISKSRYRTIDSLLDDLNKNIEMPFGVRRLTTPMGRTPIEDIQQLQHLGKSIPTSPSFKQKLRMSRTLGFNVVPSKQVFFVLNGKGRFYRTLLNPLRLPSMECLLREVSDGLQVAIFRIYSSTGVRIVNVSEILSLTPPKLIACPRHEKAHLTNFVQLPAINPKRYAIRTYKSVSDPSTSTTHSSTNENGIEKKPRGFVSAIRRNTRKTTGVSRKKAIRALPVRFDVKPPNIISIQEQEVFDEETEEQQQDNSASRRTSTPGPAKEKRMSLPLQYPYLIFQLIFALRY